ncbi:MAG: M28 family peptidase [bacterium]
MKIADRPEVQSGLQRLDAHVHDVIEDAVTICEVPAPPFAESRRAAHVAGRIAALRLGDPRTDAVGNVIRELPGAAHGRTVMLTAHLDTVFGAEVPIAVRRDGHRLAGPGIGDNSMALAALLWLGVALADLPDRGTLVLAANVGEEGLGNLRGAKALWEQFGEHADAWVILEGGTFNRAVRMGVGSRRLSIRYATEGGHSWSHFGRPSAIHALGRLIDQIAQIRVPADPKTTYNVGVIDGGRGVNSIAPDAGLLLDMRSESREALATLERSVRGLVASIADAAGVHPTIEVVGDRPGGQLPADHLLVALVETAATAVGTPVVWEAGSTDANVPLGGGAAAVCLGIARGENEHTVDEVLDTSVLPQGLRQAYLVTSALLLGM